MTQHTSPSASRSHGGDWTESARWFWGILIAVTIWKLFTASRLGLIFDECYYWEWSLHPRACYFDHPPLTAWLIAGGGALFGHTELAVRFFAVVSGGILSLSGRILGQDLFGPEAGNRAGIFLTLAPIFAGNALLMTPDTGLIPAWSCAALFCLRAIRDRRSLSPWWLASGFAAGIGMLSKYTMVLHFVSLGVVLLLSPGFRRRILFGGLISGIIAMLVFLPVLIWNARNNWVSFAHQIHHGFRNEHACLVNFQNLADYSAFLAVLVSPLLGIFCLMTGVRRFRDREFLFPAAFYWTVVLFFGFAAAKAHIEANWPMPAFVTGLVMVAGDWKSYSSGWRKAALILLVVADLGGMIGLTGLMLPGDTSGFRSFAPEKLIPSWLPGSSALKAQAAHGYRDFLSRIDEFRGPAAVASQIESDFRSSGADFLCLPTYQLVGILSFYAPSLEPLLWLPDLGRVRFPWINDLSWKGKTALVAAWPRMESVDVLLFDRYSGARQSPSSQVPGTLILWTGYGYRPEKVKDR